MREVWDVREVSDVQDVLAAVRCVLLCILEAVEGGLHLLEMLGALEVPEIMCCVLLYLLEVPEVMRSVLLCMLEDVGGDALCAALYTGGCRGWLRLLAGGVGGAGGDALCATLCAGGLRRVSSVCRRCWKCWR